MSSRALDDPVLEERRLAALASIRQLGDPVLRTPASPITVFDAELRAEAERMTRIMIDARGVGLAANQVGKLGRLAIVQLEEDGAPLPLVNPVVVTRSDEEEVATEGCLSIGEVVVEVPRAVAVTVEAQDLDGAPLEIEATGFAARVLQHEIDHLDGILMLDRTTPAQRKEALKALRGAA
ncbi:MAG: peptide deformylase [Actinomycetota bacterium]